MQRIVPPAVLAAGAIVLLAFFAYRPLFGGGMILTADTLHAWRIREIGRCLDDGQLPCRWTPDLGNGYGFPMFNYYPPLPYYVGDLLHRLGFSYLGAVDGLYFIGLVGAGLSMFLLTRRLWGNLGGLVSAVAFVYAPYLALDAYMRGALAELWALAIAPALLWAVYELTTTARARYVPILALCVAFLLLSHNLVAVIVAPAVALWAGALLLARRREALRPALLGALAVLWGVGLAAFFTLPALTEGNLVQLDSVARTPYLRDYLYQHNFVGAGDLFFQRSSDYSGLLTLEGGTPVQIGWFHWLAVALSLPLAALLWRSRREAALAVGLLAACFVVGVFMTTAASRFIWDTFDSLRFLQFPWRYIGLVAIASGGLAGAWFAVTSRWGGTARALAAGALIALFVGTGATSFDPFYRCTTDGAREVPCPGNDDEYFSERFASFHFQGSVGGWLPDAVDVVPRELPAAPARVVLGAARILEAEQGSDSLELRIEAPEPALIEAAIFDFQHWRVRIDGEAVAHEASDPSGLITFAVPVGTHEVSLRLHNTAVRSWGNGISLVAWAALALSPLAALLAPPWRNLVATLRRRPGGRGGAGRPPRL